MDVMESLEILWELNTPFTFIIGKMELQLITSSKLISIQLVTL